MMVAGSTICAGAARLHAAMPDGIAVQGYLSWSLLDNYE